MPLDKAFNRSAYCVLVRSYLLGAISVAKGVGIVFDRLEIDGDSKRCAKLVVS